MFKKATKFIVNQSDSSKELVPVESIAHNEHFRPLSLLIRKSKRMFRPDPYYRHTRFTLDDVLKPGKDGKKIEPIHKVHPKYTVTNTSKNKADGGVSVPFDPASVELKGAAYMSNEFSITVQKKSVTQGSLEALSREREIDMTHSLIKQLGKTQSMLYVVTEILEASEEAVYKKSTKADGGFMVKFYATLFAKGTRENTQSIVIPKGCTVAFGTIQIHIKDGAWELGSTSEENVIAYIQSLSGKGIVENVKEEFENHCKIFSELSTDLLPIILNTIKAVMRDMNLLEELSQKMEEVPEQNDGYELKTESPDLQGLFSTLQHSPRDRVLLAEGITYVLDALHELMEDQLLLLLESLERKIVSQQLKLVSYLLEHGLDKGKKGLHVEAELLSFSHKDEQRLTIALVELSGVQLQEDGSAVPRDQPFEAMAALFVALYTLNLLSGSK
ncbi:gasdermin-A-like [Chamaea fasciata]|uniref:gasdermin-A-like n=1 Tax=Chamaea fasciata TaxID=190680 RepID=UPI003369DEB8